MNTSAVRSSPPFLFGVAVFATVVLLLSRGVLLPQDSPAFSLESPAGVRVLLGAGFPNPGVRQFTDGTTLRSVIELTDLAIADSGAAMLVDEDAWLVDGMALDISNSGNMQGMVQQKWMSARQRLALGIRLHPDRMSRDDWVALPGIGEKLAVRIELDRHNYGDFGNYKALERVKGIGPAKLKSLQEFFVDGDK